MKTAGVEKAAEMLFVTDVLSEAVAAKSAGTLRSLILYFFLRYQLKSFLVPMTYPVELAYKTVQTA